jgi:hypothetical protein
MLNEAPMELTQKPMKAKHCEKEEGVAWIPQYVGHRGAIRALDVKTREDAQCSVCQPKESNGDINSNGNFFVDSMKNYHEATKKHVYREV